MLVSDDIDNSDIVHANEGITLPNSKTATHDAGLSSLFFARSGRVQHDDFEYIINRGRNAYFWSRTSRTINGAYRMGLNTSILDPSYTNNGAFGYPHRCLVFTNNGQ